MWNTMIESEAPHHQPYSRSKMSSEHGSVFATRLAEALGTRNITITDLSSLTEISGKTLSRYLSAETDPSLEFAARIAAALNLDLNWLAGLDRPTDDMNDRQVMQSAATLLRRIATTLERD